MRQHVFVDEHKERRHTLVAVAVPSARLARARSTMRQLIMPGQRRIHFTKERNSRRRLILDAIRKLDVRATIYHAGGHPDQVYGRAACLANLVADLAGAEVEQLVIEVDDTAINADRTQLYELVRKHGLTELRYYHMRARDECLLSIPDAIAWCWGKGRSWREELGDLGRDVRRL